MKLINTNKAPKAIWPYSQAVINNWILYSSGQIALVPETMEIVTWWISEQTIQVFANIETILAEAWVTKDDVIKTTIFLKNIDDFQTVNELYADFFVWHRPARSTVEVSRLPKDVLIEIELIANVSE